MAAWGPTPTLYSGLEPSIAVHGSEPQLSGFWNPLDFSQLPKTTFPPTGLRSFNLYILPSIHDPSNLAFYFRLRFILFRLKSSNLLPRDIAQALKVIKVKKPPASPSLFLPLWSRLPAAHITPRARLVSPDSPAETRGVLC